MAALKSTLSSRVSKGMEYTIATIFLPRSYSQTYSGYSRVGFCLSTVRCTGASNTRNRRFSGSKGARFHFSNTVVAEFTGSELRRLKHLECRPYAGKVYRPRISNVKELEMCLVDEWRRFDQSIVDAAIASSGAVVSALEAMERGTL